MKPFNLLQYPALASQRRRFHSRWTSLSGLLVGSLVAFWLMSEVQEKRLQRVQEGAALQSRLKQVQSRLSADKARQAQQKTWQQQAAHVQALSAQQRSWEALHQALLQEAGPESVQLLRIPWNCTARPGTCSAWRGRVRDCRRHWQHLRKTAPGRWSAW